MKNQISHRHVRRLTASCSGATLPLLRAIVENPVLTENGELPPRLLQIALGGVDRGDQGDPNFPAEIFQTVVFVSGDGVGLCQQQKPITGLVGFLQGDLQSGYEIRFAVGVLRLVDIRADAGSRSADLIADDRFVLCFELFDQVQNSTAKATDMSASLLFNFCRICPFWLVIYHYRRKNANGNSHFSVFLIIRGECRVLHNEAQAELLHIAELWRSNASSVKGRLFFYEACLSAHEAFCGSAAKYEAKP